jgi:hypothetical protein
LVSTFLFLLTAFKIKDNEDVGKAKDQGVYYKQTWATLVGGESREGGSIISSGSEGSGARVLSLTS